MKKVLKFLSIVLVSILLVGCGNKSEIKEFFEKDEEFIAEDSAYSVIESAKLFWTYHYDDLGKTNDTIEFICSKDGICKGTVKQNTLDGTADDKIVTLDIDGTKPEGGKIKIDFNSANFTGTDLQFGKYKCNKAANVTKVTCNY